MYNGVFTQWRRSLLKPIKFSYKKLDCSIPSAQDCLPNHPYIRGKGCYLIIRTTTAYYGCLQLINVVVDGPTPGA